MDDEPQVEQLENRIDKLENTIEKMMPSRRDALKMGGAALAGGSLMAGTASADTVDEQVGTIGGPGEEVDLVSEDIDNSNQINTKDLVSEDIDNSNQITTQDLVVNGTATGPFGGGVVFEDGDPITQHRAHVESASSDSFFAIFDLATAVDVYGGAIYGVSISRQRITFASGNVVTVGNGQEFDQGQTKNGDNFSVQPIFPMKSVIKLEGYNDSVNTKNHGYQVYTT